MRWKKIRGLHRHLIFEKNRIVSLSSLKIRMKITYACESMVPSFSQDCCSFSTTVSAHLLIVSDIWWNRRTYESLRISLTIVCDCPYIFFRIVHNIKTWKLKCDNFLHCLGKLCLTTFVHNSKILKYCNLLESTYRKFTKLIINIFLCAI